MGNHKWILVALLGLAFLLRIYNFSFPALNSEEARVGYRAYTLSTLGKDELGRPTPLIFNSLTEYKLPLASYLTAGGVRIFGKTDLGVRLPYVLLGTLLVWLTILIAKILSDKEKVWFLSGLIVAISPPLIFLSKTPNEVIVSIFLLTWLFYVLIKEKLNLLIIIFLMILITLTSVNTWMILPALTLFTILFVRPYLYRQIVSKLARTNPIIIALSVVFVLVALCLYLNIPQSERSLRENQLTLLNSPTIENSLTRLRGQGLQSAWPNFSEKILFSKLHFLVVGLLNWFGNLYNILLPGQFDATGQLNFTRMGTYPKILIIPALLGLVILLKKGSDKAKILLPLFIIISFPALLIYPKFFHLNLLAVPFLAIVISLGLSKISAKLVALILVLAFAEILINFGTLDVETKATSNLRPIWVKNVVVDGYSLSRTRTYAMSEDITLDEITPFLQWYTNFSPVDGFSPTDYPYKLKVQQLAKLELLGISSKYLECNGERTYEALVSNRDLSRANIEGKVQVLKEYRNNLGEPKAFQISVLCPEKL